ncbi:MAG: glycosyltransferase, partial [Oscillospiraceae bacterium]|nr:glycosyltransferase [Oscillospiraceae bacterium]
MADLTVVILTKNEEKNLRKCVESFCGAAKRFVIVDSGSTDGTEALCRQLDRELRALGSRLDFFYHPWNSYADQLNWGLQNTQISTEWSMRMDADEELLPELAQEIKEKLDQLKN